jgi:hypothetical protein
MWRIVKYLDIDFALRIFKTMGDPQCNVISRLYSWQDIIILFGHIAGFIVGENVFGCSIFELLNDSNVTLIVYFKF